MTKQQQGPLKQVTLLTPGQSSEAIYDEWASDYELDLNDEYGYIAPQLGVDALVAVLPDRNARVMDFGCGTGLVGAELHGRGFTRVDGSDYSAGMLEVATKKGVYEQLIRCNLTKPLSLEDAVYDAGVSVGMFGNGHVTASAIPALLRVLKPGAPLVIYCNDLIYSGGDFAKVFADYERDGFWQVLKSEPSNYMSALKRPGWAITTRRC